ncbi:MAG: tRNA (guanosine(46)-N7)-methyltransferase TrmB [Candidatus Omnitrophica bacterium]|nr:tRNA (guanosine(46)-N7)-methyltransferase TrmB [Candidatus Omnitrophota bacterium]
MAKTIYEYTPEMNRHLIAPGSIDEHLDFERIFGDDNPVEIEIGAGKGRFILAESKRRPDVNFIAIERSRKILRIGLLRAVKEMRENCRFFCWDADFVLKLLIQPKTVQAYHVYFPDPWPKKRHKKRRLFNPRFIEKMAETLTKSGILHLKTDHEKYFHETHDRIQTSGCFRVLSKHSSQESIHEFDEAAANATHYEIKWRLESRKIFSVQYQAIQR